MRLISELDTADQRAKEVAKGHGIGMIPEPRHVFRFKTAYGASTAKSFRSTEKCRFSRTRHFFQHLW